MNAAANQRKTLVFVDGRKGGPGKSMTAMALLEYLRNRKDLRSYDLEGDTGDLAVRYQGIPINPDPMGRLGAFSEVLDTLMNQQAGIDVAVVDVGSPAGDRVEAYIDEMGAADLARAGQLRLCFLWVCGRHRRSFIALENAVEHWRTREVPYELGLVVNEGITQEFDLISGAPPIQRILSQNVPLIRLPALEAEAATESEALNVSFGSYIEMASFNDTPISFSRRAAVRSWLQKAHSDFAKVPFLAELGQVA